MNDHPNPHQPGCQEFPTGWLCVSECTTVWHDRADPARDAQLRAEADDLRGGYQQASSYLERFRDVLADCLGHEEENPGDDALLSELREHFGRTGPEPTRWRDFLIGAQAMRDQIRAALTEAGGES